MKKHFLIIAIFSLIGGSSLFAQGLKIGYVDSQVILTQYSAAIKAQGDLDALTNLWSSKLDSMTLAYQQQLTNYQKQANTMPQDQQVQAQQTLVQMEQQILDFRRQKFSQPDGEIYKKQEEIFSPVKDKIYAAIEKVAKEEDLQFGDLVFFDTRINVKPGHVGIYLGDNLFAHASSKKGVTISSLNHSYYQSRFMGGRRVEPNGTF